MLTTTRSPCSQEFTAASPYANATVAPFTLLSGQSAVFQNFTADSVMSVPPPMVRFQRDRARQHISI